MDRNEQQLIDDLFGNLAQVERNSGPRDTEAERYIGQLMSRQPSSPYFMVQSLVLQEQALREAQDRIEQLERQLGQGAGGGSFLGGARGAQMGGGSVPTAGGQFRYPAPPSQYDQAPQRYEQQPQQRYPEPQQEPERGSRVGGFLTGVAQTAAGVAGGMMLGNMLGGLFGGGHSSGHSGSGTPSTASHEMSETRQIEQDSPIHEADFAGHDFGGFDDIDI